MRGEGGEVKAGERVEEEDVARIRRIGSICSDICAAPAINSDLFPFYFWTFGVDFFSAIRPSC